MVRRKATQKSKYLGHRSFGRGNVKNRRGSGNRGGRGNAGLHKHRYSWVTANEPDYFGKHGFVNPTTKEVKTINLFAIEQLALKNKLEKKDGKLYFEFEGKILGTGKLTHPVTIKAQAWSEGAEGKVKSAKGTLVSFESA